LMNILPEAERALLSHFNELGAEEVTVAQHKMFFILCWGF